MNAAAHAALRAEIINDPAGRGYAGVAADQQAALVNAPYQVPGGAAHAVNVAVGAVEGYLRSRMLMGELQRFVASPGAAPADLVEGLSELLGMLASSHVDVVVMTDPMVSGIVAQVLNGAAAAGLISAQNVADLLAMASVTPAASDRHPRVMDIFLGIEGAPNAVTAADITVAMA